MTSLLRKRVGTSWEPQAGAIRSPQLASHVVHVDGLGKLVHMSASKPKPKFGWPHTHPGFGIGKRVRWTVTGYSQHYPTRHGMYTGIEGTIIGGSGLPSKGAGSQGKPSWRILWDNNYEASFYEWALEIV